jgi:hypothetical protein
MSIFVKLYANPRDAATAADHLMWLDRLRSGVRLPALRMVARRRLVLEHLTGHQPDPSDLPDLATALGKLHNAAHARQLHPASLDRPHKTGELTVIDFVSPRRGALTLCPVPYLGLPAAIYKDANLRNFLITGDGIALVDFDDLTLAPFGYDLAKLIVTAAMTHGRPPESTVSATLDAYNAQVGDNACPPERLRAYAELHHLLTARYLHRHGYRHPWPAVRPWPAPLHVG